VKNVLKSPEPEELKNYKKRFYSQFKRWNDLKKNKETLNAIRKNLASDQKGLCAYCEMSLRLVVIDEINKELDDETIDINDLEEKIAAEELGYGTGNWPPFFTTIRWVLGAGAERHLMNISYSG